jgi:hypothetical protein
MMGATRLRGVAQWQNPSVRVHTRMGPMRVVSSVPGTHEFKAKSFVYESDLSDEVAWSATMQRRFEGRVDARVAGSDHAELGRLIERAEAGEPIFIVPPGLDSQGRVLLRFGAP